MKKYIIAHDIGTSSAKTVLVSTDGEILHSSTTDYPFYYPKPGWVEQEPHDYWKACITNTRIIMQDSELNPNDIAGIVFTTQAMGVIPVDINGEVLHRNITWVDCRAEKEAESLMNKLLGRRMFKKIIGIEITGKDVLPKLLWLKRNCPTLYENTHKVLDVNGYLKYMATGKMVAEWSGACSYTFDLKKKDWTRILFRVIGFDLNKLPDLVRSIDKVGGLTNQAAAEMGLTEGIPVFGGCDDTQSASVGSGAVNEEEAHIYLGSSAWVAVSTKRTLKFKNGAVCLQSADPDKSLVVGITESAGSNIDWIINKFYNTENSVLTKPELYKLMDKEAESVPAGSDHLVFTPWLLGERCPVSTTTTRGTVFNLGLEHSRGHFIKALCEGVANNIRWIIDNMESDFGFNIKSLRIIGGGTVNKQWLQVISDVTQKEIVTTNQPRMAGAIGAAMCAMVGVGKYSSFSDINRIVKPKDTYLPNINNKEIYDKIYEDYRNIYKSLKNAYKLANSKRFVKI